MKNKAVLLALMLWPCLVAASIEEYNPTHPIIVEKMLDIAQITRQDMLYDLGSGDGRIVIAAAKRGVQSVGIELDPEMVAISRVAIRSSGVEKLATIISGDIFATDISPATVVTLFFGLEAIDLLTWKLKMLKRGTRIVSNGSPLAGWQPTRIVDVGQKICRKPEQGKGCRNAPIYLWVMP